jgi:hypothetical protein
MPQMRALMHATQKLEGDYLPSQSSWPYASAVDCGLASFSSDRNSLCCMQTASTSLEAASGGCSLTLGTHYLQYSGKVLTAWALKCRHF